MNMKDVMYLRCRADCEGVPFPSGDLGDLDEHPVSSAKVESRWTLDDQVRDSGGKDDSSTHQGFATAQEACQYSISYLYNKYTGRTNKPFPEFRGVHEQKGKVQEVEHVGHIEDLEVAATSHIGQRTDKHDGQDDNQRNTSWIGNTMGHTENSRHCSQHPVHVAPLHSSLLRDTRLAVRDTQV